MQKDNLSAILKGYGDRINLDLQQFFSEIPSLLGVEISEYSVKAIDKLYKYSLRPSKRIRGSLAGFSYDYAAKTKYGDLGIRAGVSLELFQNYLLIVDDVMDKSEFRRGQLSLHELYLKEHHEDEHLANMLAINVGLLAQHLANMALTSLTKESVHVEKALALLHRNVLITGLGQIDDISQQITQNINDKDLIRKYSFKSSYYTFVNPIQVGLVLAGVDKKDVLKEVEEFGVFAGIAFQLHDDILGVFGNTQETGKSNLDDIKEGKLTLLVNHALKHANNQDTNTLMNALGNQTISNKDLKDVQAIFEKNGSKKFVDAEAELYAKRAKEVIISSKFWDEKSKTILIALVNYSLMREK